MKNPILYPIDQIYNTLSIKPSPRLDKDISTQVLVIGGGMAGLSAAQKFKENGFEVTLIEKNYCGAGASGKSSGFITPDSELDLTDLANEYGAAEAKKLWDFVLSGVELIKNNIEKYNIQCDYQVEDTVVFAKSKNDFKEIQDEHKLRQKLKYESHLYSKTELNQIIHSKHFYGAIRYPKTFGINAYKYCQKMKEILIQNGVQIYEDTPAISIDNKTVKTPNGNIKADYIIVCVDRFLPELEQKLYYDIFHAQTFLLISQPLSNQQIKKIFPEQKLMCWDTSLIYQYFRIAADNRLMMGGSDLVSIFWGKEQHNLNRMYKKLYKYTKQHFDLDIYFEYFWPGLIGTTRNIVPLATLDNKNNNILYISGAAGLPWAAALGAYSFECIINKNKDFDKYFTKDRKYMLNNTFEAIFGKRITFALSNLIRLYK